MVTLHFLLLPYFFPQLFGLHSLTLTSQKRKEKKWSAFKNAGNILIFKQHSLFMITLILIFVFFIFLFLASFRLQTHYVVFLWFRHFFFPVLVSLLKRRFAFIYDTRGSAAEGCTVHCYFLWGTLTFVLLGPMFFAFYFFFYLYFFHYEMCSVCGFLFGFIFIFCFLWFWVTSRFWLLC